jgi:phosphoglycerate dehydrogenase-like enzyme
MSRTIHAVALGDFDPRLRSLMQEKAPPEWRMAFAAGLSEEAAARELGRAELLLTANVDVDAALLDRSPGLTLLLKLSAGIDGIDLAECDRRGVAVARVSSGNAGPVAEHVVMLMLAALRRLPYLHENVRQGRWLKEESRALHRELRGCHIGLLGLGAVGRRVAELLAPFGANLSYYSRTRLDPATEARLQVTYAGLDDIVRGSDVLSLHLPLTVETEQILDARRIGMMKRDGVLVNCARGRLVDEQALAAALKDRRLAAAAIDTFVTEPPLGSPLLDLDNVVLSPHIAGATRDAFAYIFQRAIELSELYFSTGELPRGDRVVQSKPA